MDEKLGTRAVGHLLAGDCLGRRYTIDRLVGSGSMGKVYLAFDELLGKKVALKFLCERLADNVQRRDRVRNEVLLAHQVSHRNVCRTYDLEELEGRWVIKMEYVEGETLAERVARLGPLPLDEVLEIGRGIADGLGAAHERGVVHRDLKPQNVLIEAGTGRAVLMDFGLAQMTEPSGASGEQFAGTPAYVAPEQALGLEVDERADLYALGCVLYFMVTGAMVFLGPGVLDVLRSHVHEKAPDVRAARPDAPVWLATVIARLLAKDPARRYADAAAVRAALAGPGPRRRHRAVAALALLAVASPAVERRTFGRYVEQRPTVRSLDPACELRDPAPDAGEVGTPRSAGAEYSARARR